MATEGFTKLAYYFDQYGVLDFLLPFLLVFTISYAILQKIELLGKAKESGKKYHLIVALALGMAFVVPHIMGTYPLGYDPVQVMNETLPSISLVSISAIMLLLLMGIFGTNFSQKATPIIALAAVGFIIYIFGSALGFWIGPYDTFGWWSAETTELMIVLLVFGLVVWFITKEPSPPNQPSAAGNAWKFVSDLFERK
mgnify:CR=1 FL=1